jgi:predicted DNA-binding transcriptional regulator AlpA
MRRLWITADQLAAKLGVSVKSIRRAYRKGEIPVDRSVGLSASTWNG